MTRFPFLWSGPCYKTSECRLLSLLIILVVSSCCLVQLRFDQVLVVSFHRRTHTRGSDHGLDFRYFGYNKDIVGLAQRFPPPKLAIGEWTLEWYSVVSNYIIVFSLFGVPIWCYLTLFFFNYICLGKMKWPPSLHNERE